MQNFYRRAKKITAVLFYGLILSVIASLLLYRNFSDGGLGDAIFFGVILLFVIVILVLFLLAQIVFIFLSKKADRADIINILTSLIPLILISFICYSNSLKMRGSMIEEDINSSIYNGKAVYDSRWSSKAPQIKKCDIFSYVNDHCPVDSEVVDISSSHIAFSCGKRYIYFDFDYYNKAFDPYGGKKNVSGIPELPSDGRFDLKYKKLKKLMGRPVSFHVDVYRLQHLSDEERGRAGCSCNLIGADVVPHRCRYNPDVYSVQVDGHELRDIVMGIEERVLRDLRVTHVKNSGIKESK